MGKSDRSRLRCFRTNCSTNGTSVDESCWRAALTYRTSELVAQLFSFSSLSVHVDTFRKDHEHQVCHHRSCSFRISESAFWMDLDQRQYQIHRTSIGWSFDEPITRCSTRSSTLWSCQATTFDSRKWFFSIWLSLHLYRCSFQCQNLTSTPIETIDQLPPLSCSVATCASDTLNYLILFIISTLFSGLVLIICVVQSYQARRQSRIPVAIHAEGPLISSLSTTHTSVNA